MQIIEINPTNRHHDNQFLNLPYRLYRNIPQWVPPLEMDAERMLDRKHHLLYVRAL